jgi:hypothetical protein
MPDSVNIRGVVPLEKVRRSLATVWFGGSAIVFMVLILQTLRSVFDIQTDKAWAWAMPNIAPTLSLMISVFAAYALIPQAEEDKFVTRKSFYYLSLWLSIFYIFNIILVICAAPFSVYASQGIGSHPVDVMHLSNFWLGPLQGLTVAAIGTLFFTKSEKE